MTDSDKHINHFKGLDGEDFLYYMATNTFFVDWCYKSPMRPNKKKGELCDLLIVFDDTVIIWSVKNRKLDKTGNYRDADIKESYRQLSGAYRQLFKLDKKVELINPHGEKEVFNPKKIQNIHLIAAHVGEEEGVYIRFEHDIDGIPVHIFNRTFTEIILSELDTISDFCMYLRKKEVFFQSEISLLIEGGEEELLAYYILNKGFNEIEHEGKDFLLFGAGSWENYCNSEEYHAKKKADEVSKVWDDIIQNGREKTQDAKEIAMVLARPNRLERRVLAKYYLGTAIEAKKSDNPFFIAVTNSNSVTYCFLFMDEPKGKEGLRKKGLRNLISMGKATYRENETVVAIGEDITRGDDWDRDFCLVTSWSEEAIKYLDRQVEEGKIMPATDRYKNIEMEYPVEKKR